MTWILFSSIIITVVKVNAHRNRKGDLIMVLPNGYEMRTTFMRDFDIADMFGENAIKDTFKRAFDEWKGNYVFLTELVISLNLHIWKWYEKNETIARLYNDLWEQADSYACENLKGKELSFFYNVTD